MNSDQRPVSDNNISVWPKRASRACASCRRDKTRCDGARPCAGCSKKGYADQCIDGCDPCRRARVRCEGGKPCQRCREMQVMCAEETAVVTHRPDPSPPAPRSQRSGTTERAKLACTSCRRDNKKCDDQRPCARCIARGEECIHVGRSPKLVKLRCEGCRQDGKRCEDARPCSFCVQNKRECITHPRKGRGHGNRVKAACVTCRRDKIRCDGVRPCASCVRKGVECIDRACKACAREGLSAECTHRKAYAAENGTGGLTTATNHLSGAPQGLPPISHVTLPPPHAMYTAHNVGAGPSTQFYYPQHIIGPGQPPPLMIPGYMPDQRPGYYAVIDPNIDAVPSSNTGGNPGSLQNQNAGQKMQ